MARILLIPAPFVYKGCPLPYVPYGLLSLQAVAEESGHQMVQILQLGNAARSSYDSSDGLARAIADLVEGDEFQAVGLSTMCSSFHHSLGIAVELRRRFPRLNLWMGGPHASVMPGAVLERYPEIDAVFVGEAEATLAELCRTSAGRPLQSLDGLPGVCTRAHPQASRPPIADIDALPCIDRAADFMPCLLSDEYGERNEIPLEVARGCPGRCTFCSTRLYWGGHVRYKSSERIVAEMHRLHARTSRSHFALIGDNLASSVRQLRELCSVIAQRAPDYDWDCSLILNRLSTKDLDLLWAGKCRGLFVGLESGSQETLDRMRKGIDLGRSLRLMLEALERGFSVHTSFIVGFPWESSSHVNATYQLHADLLKRGVRSHITTLCPLPGTELEQTERLHPWEGQSAVAFDELPLGPAATALTHRCPQLFTQHARFETPGVDRFEINAAVRAAASLTGYYARLAEEQARQEAGQGVS